MKSVTAWRRVRPRRLVIISLLSFAGVAALLAFAVSASKKASNTSSSPTTSNGSKAATKAERAQNPNAPLAPAITATLSDNIPAATKVAPGGTINYTAVITNTGVTGTDDAAVATYSHVIDSNTTLVAGSVHASPIAFNNAYTTAIGNTLLEVSNSPSSTA